MTLPSRALPPFFLLCALSSLGCQGEGNLSQNGSMNASTSTGDSSFSGTMTANPSNNTATSGGPGDTGPPPATVPTSPTWDTADCTIPQPGLQYTRRITHREYAQALRWFFDAIDDKPHFDTFQGRGGRNVSLPQDENVQGIDNNVGAQAPETNRTMAYLLAAEQVAVVVKDHDYIYGPLMPCFRGEGQDAEFQSSAPSCLEPFIKKGAPLLWGQPLADDELQDLKASYANAHQTLGALSPKLEPKTVALESLATLLEVMLMSPKFLYRVELGSGQKAQGGARGLTDVEVASRLAVLMWGRGPDEALRQAAEAGELHTPEQVRAQVDRIWQTEEGRYGIQNFLHQWLELDGSRKGRKYDIYDSDPKERGLELRGKNDQELERIVQHFFDQEDAPTLKTLLTSTQTVLHDDLAQLYGLSPMGEDDFYLAQLDPKQRSGILTRASWMLSQSQSRAISPTFRGLFIMNRLLCNTLPPPPDTLNTNVPENKRLSPRADFEAKVTTNPDCAGCHTQFDYFGYALDNYDYYGRWRTNYKDYNHEGDDFPIDAKVTVTVDATAHEVDGAVELMEVLGQSQQVRQCAVHHWFAYTMGRTPQVDWASKKGGDYCTMTTLQDTFEKSGGDLRDLLTATVLSDAFLYLSPSLTPEEN